jgi:hypothetical protein
MTGARSFPRLILLTIFKDKYILLCPLNKRGNSMCSAKLQCKAYLILPRYLIKRGVNDFYSKPRRCRVRFQVMADVGIMGYHNHNKILKTTQRIMMRFFLIDRVIQEGAFMYIRCIIKKYFSISITPVLFIYYRGPWQ